MGKISNKIGTKYSIHLGNKGFPMLQKYKLNIITPYNEYLG